MKYVVTLFSICFLIACNSTNEGNTETTEETDIIMDDNLSGLFEDAVVVKLHAFSLQDQMNTDDYPYGGKEIPKDLYSHLDENIVAKANETGEAIFACYALQDGLYILRVPGEGNSKRSELCTLGASGKLEINQHLAHAWCENDRCGQQDAWLADLDLDNHLELITRSATLEAETEVESDFKVYTQSGDGNFVEGKGELAVKEHFPLIK